MADSFMGFFTELNPLQFFLFVALILFLAALAYFFLWKPEKKRGLIRKEGTDNSMEIELIGKGVVPHTVRVRDYTGENGKHKKIVLSDNTVIENPHLSWIRAPMDWVVHGVPPEVLAGKPFKLQACMDRAGIPHDWPEVPDHMAEHIDEVMRGRTISDIHSMEVDILSKEAKKQQVQRQSSAAAVMRWGTGQRQPLRNRWGNRQLEPVEPPIIQPAEDEDQP